MKVQIAFAVLAVATVLAGCNRRTREAARRDAEYARGGAMLEGVGRLRPGMTETEVAAAMGKNYHIAWNSGIHAMGGPVTPGATAESFVPLNAGEVLKLSWRLEDVTNPPPGQSLEGWCRTQTVCLGSFVLETNRNMLMQKIYTGHSVEKQ
jgi:hypothetical protein